MHEHEHCTIACEVAARRAESAGLGAEEMPAERAAGSTPKGGATAQAVKNARIPRLIRIGIPGRRPTTAQVVTTQDHGLGRVQARPHSRHDSGRTTQDHGLGRVDARPHPGTIQAARLKTTAQVVKCITSGRARVLSAFICTRYSEKSSGRASPSPIAERKPS